MNIAITATYWEGHHPTHLIQFSEALLRLGHCVVVLCPEPDLAAGRMESIASRYDPGALLFAAVPVAPTHPARSAAFLKELDDTLTGLQASTDISIEFTFMTHLDPLVRFSVSPRILSRHFGRPFAGLFLHPGSIRLTGFRTRRLWRNLRSYEELRSIAVLDESAAPSLAMRVSKPVIVFPDVTDERTSDETEIEAEIRRRSAGRQVIGFLGSLERRKGVLELLQQIEIIPRSQAFFVIAGKIVYETFSRPEREILERFLRDLPENVVVENRYFEDERHFNAVIRQCDLIHAVYPGFPSSSNMLTKAAVFEVPIIVAGDTLMAERVRRFHLGFVKQDDDPSTLSRIITTSAARELASTEAFRTGCEQYRSLHGMDRLTKAFATLLERSV